MYGISSGDSPRSLNPQATKSSQSPTDKNVLFSSHNVGISERSSDTTTLNNSVSHTHALFHTNTVSTSPRQLLCKQLESLHTKIIKVFVGTIIEAIISQNALNLDFKDKSATEIFKILNDETVSKVDKLFDKLLIILTTITTQIPENIKHEDIYKRIFGILDFVAKHFAIEDYPYIYDKINKIASQVNSHYNINTDSSTHNVYPKISMDKNYSATQSIRIQIIDMIKQAEFGYIKYDSIIEIINLIHSNELHQSIAAQEIARIALILLKNNLILPSQNSNCRELFQKIYWVLCPKSSIDTSNVPIDVLFALTVNIITYYDKPWDINPTITSIYGSVSDYIKKNFEIAKRDIETHKKLSQTVESALFNHRSNNHNELYNDLSAIYNQLYSDRDFMSIPNNSELNVKINELYNMIIQTDQLSQLYSPIIQNKKLSLIELMDLIEQWVWFQDLGNIQQAVSSSTINWVVLIERIEKFNNYHYLLENEKYKVALHDKLIEIQDLIINRSNGTTSLIHSINREVFATDTSQNLIIDISNLSCQIFFLARFYYITTTSTKPDPYAEKTLTLTLALTATLPQIHQHFFNSIGNNRSQLSPYFKKIIIVNLIELFHNYYNELTDPTQQNQSNNVVKMASCLTHILKYTIKSIPYNDIQESVISDLLINMAHTCWQFYREHYSSGNHKTVATLTIINVVTKIINLSAKFNLTTLNSPEINHTDVHITQITNELSLIISNRPTEKLSEMRMMQKLMSSLIKQLLQSATRRLELIADNRKTIPHSENANEHSEINDTNLDDQLSALHNLLNLLPPTYQIDYSINSLFQSLLKNISTITNIRPAILKNINDDMFKFKIYFLDLINDNKSYVLKTDNNTNFKLYLSYIQSRLSTLFTATTTLPQVLFNELFNTSLDLALRENNIEEAATDYYEYYTPFHEYLSNITTSKLLNHYRYCSVYWVICYKIYTHLWADIDDHNITSFLDNREIIHLMQQVIINRQNNQFIIKIPKFKEPIIITYTRPDPANQEVKAVKKLSLSPKVRNIFTHSYLPSDSISSEDIQKFAATTNSPSPRITNSRIEEMELTERKDTAAI